MNSFDFAVLAVFAVSVACSPAPIPVSRSLRDPSNPSAAEGALPASSEAAVAASMTSHAEQPGTDPHPGHGPAGAGAADAGSVAITYTCPMHPQITSPTPGQCPICGMNLVPKK
jgi:hypothetical protein